MAGGGGTSAPLLPLPLVSGAWRMRTAATARGTAEKAVVQAEVVGGQGGHRGEGGGSAVRPAGWQRQVGGAAGPRCGRRAGGGGSAVRRVGSAAAVLEAASRRSGAPAVRPPWWRRRVGGAATAVAAALQWCRHRGGRSGSVVRPPSWRWHVGGAAAVVAAAGRRCGGSVARPP